ncbi:hypothetical protein BOX15_Mlig025505g5 [Macrostomum lignano]|uniref:Uncharacterized protein n=1 Tax=Macrostomum lignano TaxID=282301 RepID=A0A267GLR9_9PLAT|nr:hypothetical protein BOX15_Mlig025505g5 [Macrostomum lignano]
MMVSGPSRAGKSTFCLRLLSQRLLLFDQPPKRMIWYHGCPQPELHATLRRLGVQVCEGLSNLDLQPHDLIVIDDLLDEAAASRELRHLFTREAHHKPCFVILITQNLFFKGREWRTISINCTYIVLFNNPRDASAVQALSQQCFPKRRTLLVELMDRLVRDGDQRYLLLDFHPASPHELRLRANFLPDEAPQRVYL